jgi:ATP-binding cassette subfamily B multidrug efflux pump
MLKTLMHSIREYKKDAWLTPLFVSGEVVMEIVIPLMMAKLIDNGINVSDMSYVLKMGGLLVAACIVSLAFGTLSGRFAARASAGFAKNLRHDLFYDTQDFSFGNIDKFSTSSLITRMTTDVTNVQNAFMMVIRIAVRSPLMLIFAFFMIIKMSPKVSVVFVFILPVLAVLLLVLMNKAFPTFKKVFKTYDKMNNTVGEDLHGIRVVKSFAREEHEKEKFNSVSEDIYKYFTKAEMLVVTAMPVMQAVMYGTMIGVAWISAKLIVNGGGAPGAMTTGELTSIITYTVQILMSLIMLSVVLVMITISKNSAERITEVLNEKPSIADPKDPVKHVRDGSVSFSHVDFSYAGDKKTLCLKDADIEIPSGSTVGILGGTGSSKSTFVQLIPRLYDTTSGSVSVGGTDVRKYDLRSLRDSVAMVLQKNILFAGTVKENMRWGNKDATDEQIRKACELACADEFIELLPDKYDSYVEQEGANFSGGQRQRLCIARALLKSPKVLILDDSTSAVDTKTDSKINEALRTSLPECTKIIIAQRISSVINADKIILLDEGRISACGTHDELMKTSDVYNEIFRTKNKEVKADA